jgi:hypothetical protein
MAFIYDLSDTWNNAGISFNGIKLNATDTASASGSKLIDLQINGASKFTVGKTGNVIATGIVESTVGGFRFPDGTTQTTKATVNSVSGTGTVNGITLTGSVTDSGSLTLGGTLGNIANSQLTNSAITINGTSTPLGGSIAVGTVTSVSGTGTVNGLTLTGSVTTSGSLTLGGTLGNIANSQLTNSAITINGTSTALGGSISVGTVTSVAALTLGTSGTDLASSVANGTTTPVITLNVPTASAANRGALSPSDWSTFNAKQAALVSGTNIKTVGGASLLGSGDVGTIGLAYGGTGATTESGARTALGLGTAAVLNAGVAGGVATLDGSGTVPTSQLPGAVLGGLNYQGTWNASTNVPTLASSTGSKGYYYVVSTAGSTNLNGITDWKIGDWAVYDGSTWQKVDNTDAVSSVNGYTGAVVLTTSDVAQGTNLYFTQAAARASVSAGTGISYNSTSGVITNSAPDQTVALTGAGTTTVTGTYPNFTITSNDSTVGTVTSVAASGGTTGLTFTGSPITTAGTLTLGGTLDLDNGGTGATTAAGARTALGLGTAATTDASAYATAAQGAKADTAVQTIASADGSVVISGTTAIDLSVAVAGATSNVLLPARNTTGATLTKGTAVYISGATGQLSTVSKAIATSDATSAQTLGLVTADIANNSNGNVTLIGTITNIDTSAYTDGQQLYLSPTTAGTLTATKPYAPLHLVYMAVVERAHPSQGKLFVKVQNGYEMDELHDVSAQSPTNGQTLVYNSTTGLWEKNTVSLTAGVNGTLPVANGGTGVTTSTGSGSVVLSTSPTLVTPVLGAATATSLTLTKLALTVDSPFYTGGNISSGANALGIGTTGAANLGLFTNNTERMRITSNGDALINTTTSLYGYANNPSIELNGVDGSTIGLKKGNVAGSYISHSTNLNIFNTTANGIVLGTNNTERMRIDSAGNVGIGTASPSSLGGNITTLDVSGASGGAVRFQRTATTATSAYVAAISGEFRVASADTNPLTLLTNNTERLRITSAGNVGVGTTAPDTRMTVSSTSQYAINTLNPTSVGGSKSGIAFYGLNSSTATQFYAGISADFTATAGGAQTGAMLFETINNNSVGERMRITGAGDVGIGTTTPQGRLEVASTDAITSLWVDTQNAGVSASNYSQVVLADNNALRSWWRNVRDGSGKTAFGYNNHLAFLSGAPDGVGTERMRIDAAGLVGIGTSSPSTILDATQASSGYWTGSAWTGTPSAITITNKNLGGYDPVFIGRMTDGGGTSKNAFAIGAVGTSSWTAGDNASQTADLYFAVRNNAGGISERMRITTLGNVGVGTSSPVNYTGYKTLTLEDATNGGVIVLRNTGATASIEMAATPSISYLKTVGSQPLWFGTNNTERMRIDASGNVLVGTTTARNRLTVQGTVFSTPTLGTASGQGFFGESAGYGMMVGTSGFGYGWIQQQRVDGSATAYSLLLQPVGGNVGIGTDSPGAALDVSSFSDTKILLTHNNSSTRRSFIGSNAGSSGSYNALILGSNATDKGTQSNTGLASWYQEFGPYDVSGNAWKVLYQAAGGAVTERMRIDEAGNVGIGTSSITPIFGRTVKIFNSGSGGTLEVGGTTINARFFGSEGAGIAGVGTTTNTAFNFITNDTERMRITSLGNVLFGTTTAVDGRVTIAADTGNSGSISTTNNGLTNYYPMLNYHGGTLRSYMAQTAFGFTIISTNVFSLVATTDMTFSAGGAERARISSAGYFEFPNSTFTRPGSTGQYIVGAANGGFYQQDATNYYTVTTSGGSTSDATLKKDVQQLEGALQKICAVRGVSFKFIEEPLSTSDCGTQIGVIAQEIEAQFPEIVVTHENGTKAVRYDRLVAPLIEAIKELTARVAQLEGN